MARRTLTRRQRVRRLRRLSRIEQMLLDGTLGAWLSRRRRFLLAGAGGFTWANEVWAVEVWANEVWA